MTLDADIFKYKPELKYILEDINTVNNISDSEIVSERKYIKNRGSVALEILDENIDRVNDLKRLIDKRLKDMSIKYKNRQLDESLNPLITTLTDGDSYINDGSISYGLYKDCIGQPIIGAISDEWERYHTDIEGRIEGEIYPYLNTIEEDNLLMKDALLKASVNHYTYDTLDELKQKELIELENLMKIKNKRQELYNQPELDFAQIEEVDREIEKKEVRNKVESSISEIAIKFANKSKDNIGTAAKLLDEDHIKKKKELYRQQREKFKDKIKIDNKSFKLIIYEDFRKKREGFYSKKQENKNLYSSETKNRAQSSLYTNSLLYSGVISTTIRELNNKTITEDMAPGLSIMLEGIENVLNNNEASMVNFKNILSASNKRVKDHLKDIEGKDKTRLLYKSFND